MRYEEIKATKPFDIFISYKSENITWVNLLKHDLQRRGVKVWLDREQIRPGELFAEALENGLQMSKAMGLVITPESLKSNWVKEEYYRALSLVNEDSLHLIPILLEKAELPGFLKGRQYIDFSDDSFYEANVDRLVWPGITGKRIVIAWVLPSKRNHYLHHHHYYEQRSTLYTLVKKLPVEVVRIGLELEPALSILLGDVLSIYRPARHLVFINPLEDDLEPHLHCYPPKKYIDFIFKLRELTRGTENEVAFVLQYKHGGLDVANGVSEEALKRLKHYFVIHNDEPDNMIAQNLQNIWYKAQGLLLDTETWNTKTPTLTPSHISVYGIFEDGSKFIRKMKISFIANCFIKESDISFYIESSTLIAQFIGKSINISRSDSEFFYISTSGDKLILTPKGLNGVWLDSKSNIRVNIVYDTKISTRKIDVHLEFFRS